MDMNLCAILAAAGKIPPWILYSFAAVAAAVCIARLKGGGG